MKALLLPIFVALALLEGVGTLRAQEPQPMPTLAPGLTLQWQLHWPAIAERLYFVQYSEDLIHWAYLKSVTMGEEDPITELVPDISTEFTTLNATRMFYRLRYIDPAPEWVGWGIDWSHFDHDNDGLHSYEEVMLFDTDPFVADTDGNGVLDGDEDPDGDGFSSIQEKSLNADPLKQNIRPPPELKVRVRSWTTTQFDHWWREPFSHGDPPAVDVHELTFLDGVVTHEDLSSHPTANVPTPPPPNNSYAPPTLTSSAWTLDATDPPNADGTISPLIGLDGAIGSEWMTGNTWKNPYSSSGWTALAKRLQLVTPTPLLDPVRQTWLVIKGSFDASGQPVTIPVQTVTLELPAGETEGPLALIAHPPPAALDTMHWFELAPIEILTPRYVGWHPGADVALKHTHRLRVAKWEEAFEINGDNATLLPNFNELDQDRFYLRVPMPWLEGEGTTTVKIRVEGADGITDPENEIEMTELTTSPGVFMTRALILVSNTVDDTQAGGTDEGLDDVTHMAKLGDTVTFTINGPDAFVCEVSADVPVRATANLTVWRHDVPGVRIWDRIDEVIDTIQATFAQVGVKFEITKETANFETQDFNLYVTEPGQIPGTTRVVDITTEMKSFLQNNPTSRSSLGLYFVRDVIGTWGIASVPSVIAKLDVTVDDKLEYLVSYQPCAFVCDWYTSSHGTIPLTKDWKPFTGAHEVMHLFIDDQGGTDGFGHVPSPTNILTGGTSAADTVSGTKRITLEHEAIIHESSFVELVD